MAPLREGATECSRRTFQLRLEVFPTGNFDVVGAIGGGALGPFQVRGQTGFSEAGGQACTTHRLASKPPACSSDSAESPSGRAGSASTLLAQKRQSRCTKGPPAVEGNEDVYVAKRVVRSSVFQVAVDGEEQLRQDAGGGDEQETLDRGHGRLQKLYCGHYRSYL